MKTNQSGFTIVELLIVIVVVGILTLIAVTSFGTAQWRASNASIIEEGVAWSKTIKAYHAAYGSFPNVTQNYYCLGTGFPVGFGGVPRCRDYKESVSGIPESDNAFLMTELAKAGKVSQGPKTAVGDYVGPFIYYFGNQTLDLIIVLKGTSIAECPKGWDVWWTDSTSVVFCRQYIAF
ncbi:prepilin-type N-terminal cleavage/methylation domain-containing protein [Candidatus Saccharibacteria bacterium]|nr:prepilin-type N-terminal cleavage/methylation domain-containing protein [Candidatus Saccharibacteria bacterium]